MPRKRPSTTRARGRHPGNHCAAGFATPARYALRAGSPTGHSRTFDLGYSMGADHHDATAGRYSGDPEGCVLCLEMLSLNLSDPFQLSSLSFHVVFQRNAGVPRDVRRCSAHA